MDEKDYSETYALMLEGELARVLRGRKRLVPEAQAALDAEVARRGLDAERLRKWKGRSLTRPHKKSELEERMGKKRLGWRGILVSIASSIAVCAVLDYFHHLDMFWPVFITLMAPGAVIWGFPELRRRGWFWAVAGGLVLAHVALFAGVGWPWGTRWVPGRSIAGMMTIELIPIFALISWLERRLARGSEEGTGEGAGREQGNAG